MNNLKDWVVQLRYPYTALILATIWLGTAVLIVIRKEADINYLLTLVSLATVVIALIGFSTKRH